MPETFYIGEKKYTIPDNLIDSFLNEKPDAVKGFNYLVGDKSYTIPPSLQEQFAQQNPNAVLKNPPVNLDNVLIDPDSSLTQDSSF